MASTDTKFFTNEEGNDLYSRFDSVLKSYTQYFDVLVGYFRTSGFFRMYESLENVEKIRILVGLNVDNFTVQIIDRAKQEIEYKTINPEKGKEIISEEIKKEFEQTEPASDVEKGVRVFIDWLKSGKLEMKMYTKAPIHAKVYIMRKDEDKVPDTFGSVITGSSNFSEAGLKGNLEFNVELKDRSDVEFALNEFEELWKDGVDIKEAYIKAVEDKTWVKDDIKPYELYLKTLYEYFGEEIDVDKEDLEYLVPSGYMKLQYQLDAVAEARRKLDAYNGVFISDVVGLGKTNVCAMLANTFERNSHKLIICPPTVTEHWNETIEAYCVPGCKVVSLGKLDEIIKNGTEKYDYVFVDEAHRFRSNNTDSYEKLHSICYGKKVILITATPFNNYTSDIENLIYLFQDKNNGNINGIKNLEDYFKKLKSNADSMKNDKDEYLNQLKNNSEKIRDDLLREIMIRRTRKEISTYYQEDMQNQGLKFPTAGKPEKICYEFDENTDAVFKETIKIIKNFHYTRYTPLLYLKDEAESKKNETSQNNMVGFMKSMLVKRLESSFYAFERTIDRFIKSYEKFIEMVKSGRVLISKKVDVYDLLDNGDDDKLLDSIEKGDVMEFETTDFKPNFITELEDDLSKLKSMAGMWADIEHIEADPKLDEFKKQLKSDENLCNHKVVVFTESKETGEYLYENLKELYSDRVVNFSSQSSSARKNDIQDSFDPEKEQNKNDKYDLLITTDVLSEGVNLNRANAIINYDLPWNPTKIMQRVGRINRINSKFDKIYIYNFFPTDQSENEIGLEACIEAKLQEFHDTLGDDMKYLSDTENTSPKGLFDDLTKNIDENDEDVNPELEYLNKIRDIRDNDPKLYNKIKALPKMAKAGKNSDSVDSTSTISFIKKGALKKFFISTGNEDTKEINFIDAIKYIESSPEEKYVKVGADYFDHFEKNSDAFDIMLKKDDIPSDKKPNGRETVPQIVSHLRLIRFEPGMTEEGKQNINTIISRLEEGAISSKKLLNKLKEKCESILDPFELYSEIMNILSDKYLKERDQAKAKTEDKKQVVLSAYLVNGRD